jgi:mRNA interferase MazF
MPSYLKNDVLLVKYPFSDLSATKIRPAVVVSGPHQFLDVFIVPLTSKTAPLSDGEFVLADWRAAGLHVPTAAKRGIYTVHPSLVQKRVGALTAADAQNLEQSLTLWLGLP